MIKKATSYIWVSVICYLLLLIGAMQSFADEAAVVAYSEGFYVATVEVAVVNINREYHSTDVLKEAYQGEHYRIIEDMGDGWLKIEVNSTYGYIPLDGNTSVSKLEDEAAQREILAEANDVKRQELVNYAMQFVGGRYSYGGSDPRTGVDCSGFTKYVLQNGAGVNVSRSSQSQAGQGISVNAEQMQPGDLIFYGNGKRINHVGMYIGDGQIVHASTNRTGIKVSTWNYRQPVKIVNVLGDV